MSEHNWYKIEAKAQDKGPAKIFIYSMIGEGFFDEGVSARSFISALEAIDNPKIDLHLNSPGGNYYDSVAIYNALRRHPATVTTYVDGMAASGASVVALAGDDVIMAAGSQMMIHESSGVAMGKADDMRQLATRLEKIDEAMASIYAAKAGGEPADWRKAMKPESWYNAQEAVDEGLADRVEKVEAPAEVQPQANFDLSRFQFAGRERAPQPVAVAGRRRPLGDTKAVGASLTTTEPPAAQADEQPPASVEGTHQTKGAGRMTDQAKLREALGLTAEASEEEVRGALVAAGLASPPPTASAEPEVTDLAQAKKIADASGAVIVDKGVWEDSQARIQEGVEAAAKLRAQERDAVIAAAVQDGRIPPASVPTWEALFDKDPKTTAGVIAELRRNSVPVAELGYGGGIDADDPDDMGEFAHLFPPVAKGA